MAKLYFYYSTMNAGKSTTLLQSSFNYRERGMDTLLLTAAFDDRFERGKVTSRIGLSQEASLFHEGDNLFEMVADHHFSTPIHCVLVDEAQFLSKEQVWQLTDVCDQLSIPVLCYGIRTDFQGQLFPGSKWLLAWADTLEELKTICHCGTKATMVVRVDEHGDAIQEGSQVEIGGNDRYVSLCRRHFKEAYLG
ncbi:thymidine kinase [Leucothrix mucor]|jgi:thymidine kinase|uniref:thymidine kinase n=1 Tax=Leucothrix mucor TaxID=45248 RepID=UPI0003B5C8D7|nr:thymidine kinase [Leucothrix mucor]